LWKTRENFVKKRGKVLINQDLRLHETFTIQKTACRDAVQENFPISRFS